MSNNPLDKYGCSVCYAKLLLQLRNSSSDSVLEEDTSKANSRGFGVYAYQQNGSRNTTDEDGNYQSQYENAFAPTNKYECSTAGFSYFLTRFQQE